MGRRVSALLLTFVLVVATAVGIGLPAAALADTTYTTCPSFATFKADVQAISGSGTINFGRANCTLNADSSITTQENSDVTINGHGLILDGETSGSPGSFALLRLGNSSNLAVDHTTVEFVHYGIITFFTNDDNDNIILTNSSVIGTTETAIGAGPNTSTTLTNSVLSGNGNWGIETEGDVTLANSTVSLNDVGGIGVGGMVTVTNSVINGNHGEGIFTASGSTSATVTNSTIDGNDGTGIATSSGSLSVTNSTIANNGNDGIDQDTGGSVTLKSDTINGNDGHGLWQGAGGLVAATASVLADNGAANCSAIDSLDDNGYNISTDASCAFYGTNFRNSVPDSALRLGKLGNNGGPTQTVPLLPGSIAIDAIPTIQGTCVAGATTDQRQLPRPQGAGCDIGAFEEPVSTPFASLRAANNGNLTLLAYLVNGPFGGRPIGLLSYRDGTVSLSLVMPLALAVSGQQAMVVGTAQLADGSPVAFTLNARASYPQSTIRLRLSNGYDSGEQSVSFLRITSSP